MPKTNFCLPEKKLQILMRASRDMVPAKPLPRKIVTADDFTLKLRKKTREKVVSGRHISAHDFLGYLLPDIISSIFEPSNVGKQLDIPSFLNEHIVVQEDSLQEAMDAIHMILEASGRIHHALRPHEALEAARVDVTVSTNAHETHSEASVRLKEVCELAETLGRDLNTVEYYEKYPTTMLDVSNIAVCSAMLIGLCAGAFRHEEWDMDEARKQVQFSVERSSRIVREIRRVRVSFEDIMALAKKGEGRGGFPLFLRGMCDTAYRAYKKRERVLLEGILDTNVLPIDTDDTCVGALVFDSLRTSDAAVDTYDTSTLCTELVTLARVLYKSSKTPPFSVFVGHSNAKPMLRGIIREFPEAREPSAAGDGEEVLARAVSYTELEGATDMKELLRKSVRERAAYSVRQGHFDAASIMDYYRGLYKSSLPSVFSSGLLSFACYQVYQDVCCTLGLRSAEKGIIESVFFSSPPETIIPEAYAWFTPPLVPRDVVEVTAACRDLILSYTRTETLPSKWLNRLLALACSSDDAAKAAREYTRIQKAIARCMDQVDEHSTGPSLFSRA